MRALGYKSGHVWMYNRPMRLISSKRAKKLTKQGVCVWWSVEVNSYVWSEEELYDRKAVREEEYYRGLLVDIHKVWRVS